MDERELNEMRLKIALMSGRKFERGFKDKAKVFMLGPDETVLPGYEMQPGDIVRWSHGDPDWPRDIAAAWELEESITDYDDRTMYTKHLIAVLENDKGIEHEAPWSFRMLHATAEQRCRAWLAWQEAVQQEAQP
jgi:hypothetical protein